LRGSKTQKSKAWVPLAPILEEKLLALYSQRLSDELMFPGRTRFTRGKQISDRKKLFTKIAKLTREQYGEPVVIVRQTQYMRRFFGTQVAALTPDVNTVRTLMRHTNLGTTSNYMMAVNEYQQAAVKTLDVIRGRFPGGGSTRNNAPEGPKTLPRVTATVSDESVLAT